jgi:hypothetical protein
VTDIALLLMMQVILTAARATPDSALDMKELFGVALEKFKSLHEDETLASPNSATYEFFLKACHRLLPEGVTRSKLVDRALDLCRQRALVTGQACREAFKCDPILLFKKLDTSIEDEAVGRVFIPTSWCNQVPNKWRVREVKL